MLTRPLRWLSRLVLALVGVAALAVVGILVWNQLAPPPPYTPFERTSDIANLALSDGTTLAVRHVDTSGTKPPVILVHGGPGAPGAWSQALIDELTALGHDVYDYHQVGGGLSSRLASTNSYSVARHVADLEAVRAATGAEQVVLLGTSWGAQLIANYLAAHPDRATQAVLVSPGVLWAPAYTDATRLTESGRRSQNEVVGRFLRIRFAVILTQMLGGDIASRLLPDSVMDGTYQAFVEALNMRSGCPGEVDTINEPLPGYGYWANAMTTRDTAKVPDPRDALRAVDIPMLIVRGTCDYIAPAVAEEYVEIFGAQFIAVKGAGHMLATERPEDLTALVADFLG